MIRFDLIFSDNKVAEVSHFCFGVLKDRLNKGTETRGSVITRFNRRDVHLAAVVYYPSCSDEGPFAGVNVDERELFTFVEEIVNAVPFVREITTVGMHPITNKVYVKVRADDVNVDQTMMALFLVRNLTYLRDIHKVYQTARSKGYTPLASIVISGLVSSCQTFGSTQERLYLRTPGEYNLFNILTFGKRALIRFLRGEPGDWFQSDWITDHIYHRDMWFENQELEFIGFQGERDDRLLIDCLSIENDEEFLGRTQFDQQIRSIDYLETYVNVRLGPIFQEAGVPLTV